MATSILDMNHPRQNPVTIQVNDIHRFIVAEIISSPIASLLRKDPYPSQDQLLAAIKHSIEKNKRRLNRKLWCKIPELHLDQKDIATVVFKAEFPRIRNFEIVENKEYPHSFCATTVINGVHHQIPVCISDIHEKAMLYLLGGVIKKYQQNNLNNYTKTEYYLSLYIHANIDRLAEEFASFLDSYLSLLYIVPDKIIEELLLEKEHFTTFSFYSPDQCVL